MRRLLAVAALGAAAGTATAQSGTVTGGVTTTRTGNGSAMPGQVVGNGFNLAGSAPQPVGTPLPPAGSPLPPAGTPNSRPYDPNRPLDVFRGTGINPTQMIAPVPNFPPLPGQEKNLIDRLYDRLDAVFSYNPFAARTAEPPPRPMNVTPGIFRRNRERFDDRMWRRD
jgi:hypothetical protein